VKLAVVLWTLVSLFGATLAGAAAGAQRASADPMAAVPADSLFCVRINNLTGTMGKIDQFLTGVSPIGVSMLLPAQLSQLLGSPEPAGINMAGSFAIFGPLPGGDTPDISRIGVLVPMSDYKQFTSQNPNVVPPDAQGIATIGKEMPMFVVADMPGFALVTPTNNRQALIEMKKQIAGMAATSLAKRLSPDELKRAQDAPLWAYANIQMVSKLFGPMIEAKLQEAKKMMEQVQPQGQAGAAMDMNMGMVNTLMKELQSASLTLDPTATAIRAGFVATATPNTETAKALQGAAGTPDKKFMQYLENGAVMNLVMSLDPATWTRLNNFYFDLMAKSAGKTVPAEEIAKLKKWSADAANALTGTAAVSFSAAAKSKPPFRIQYALGLKDPQAFSRALDQTQTMFQSGFFADLMKQSGVTMKFDLKRKAETYKDVPIDAIRVAINPTDPNSEQAKAFTAMFGQAIDVRLAVVNNLAVYVISSDPGAGVRKLIDQAKSGATPPAPSEVASAMQLIPGSDKANVFATFNLLRAMQIASAVAPMPVPQTSPQSQGSIAIAERLSGGTFSVELALPKQHLMEMMGAVMQMQMQGQEQGPTGQP